MRAQRRFGLPLSLERALLATLSDLGFAADEIHRLAPAVLRLSDHFIGPKRGPTPWSDPQAVAAYLAYFFPLNYVRVAAALEQGLKSGLPRGFKQVVDFGSGPGVAQLALSAAITSDSVVCSEPSSAAIAAHQKLLAGLEPAGTKVTWQTQKQIRSSTGTLAVLSYSLNEAGEVPSELLGAEFLFVLEPSTHDAGRKLMALRRTLLDRGFYAWAPCTHQQSCPLLEQSARDWCHDRIFFDPPSWFASLESHLPMKNQSVTFSYLLMGRSAPTAPKQTAQLSDAAPVARIIGDTLIEKGKVRQLICRGPEREFLAWLTRNGPHQEIPHGLRVELPESVNKVSNEIRVTAPLAEI